ncbi:DUF1648 domain-containing protein [Hymenobacter psychrotolerans]|uniref:DUF1648 domain-containing protein n=1 Tax=Hymenobacter psychrotolerans TaxID=344998 RepID=UPI000934A524
MKNQRLLGGVIVVLIAALPLLLCYYLDDLLPTQVPTHYTNGQADRFASQQRLREVATLPLVLYCVLTLIPQVHRTGFNLWRSHRQRQLRAVLVTALSVMLLAVLYRVISPSLIGIKLV